MAKKDTNRSIKITLDHSDMTTKYKELAQRSQELRDSLSKLNEEGKGNTREAQAMQKQYEKTTQELQKHETKVAETQKILNDLSGATYKQLLDVKKQLQKELKNETRGTEEFSAKSEQLTRVQNELKTVQGEMTSVSGSLLQKLSSAPGIVGMMTNSIKGATVACKAFIANPVGAVIAAIGAAVAICVKGFKEFSAGSEEGALKANKALAPVKVIVTELGKGVKWIGGHVAELFGNLTTGIYKSLGYLAKYSETAKEVYDNMTRQYEIEEMNYNVRQRQLQLSEKEAEYTRDLADLKLKLRQTDKYSAEERNLMMDEYLSKENELMGIKRDIAAQEYELWEMESKQDENNYEANMKGAQLKSKIYQAETEHSNNLASMDRRRLALQKEINGEKENESDITAKKYTREESAIDEWHRLEKEKLAIQYKEGSLSRAIYLQELEDLEMVALRSKFDIYELDLDRRKEIEDEIYSYKMKLMESEYNQYMKNPILEQSNLFASQRIEIEKKMGNELQKLSAQNITLAKDDFLAKKEMNDKYQSLAINSADTFGGILGEFIGNSERSAEEFQYNMIMLALNSLQQMALIWAGEHLMSQTAKLGPIFGPVAAAAGIALINGAFAGVKASIKRPSTADDNTCSANNTKKYGIISVQNGFATGGYTGEGSVYEPAGIVHKGEYVIPQWQMQLPETMSMVRALESTRLGASGSAEMQGYASGGMVTDGSADIMGKIYDLLLQIRNNPIPAYVVLSEMEKAKLRQDRSTSYGSKN